MKRTLCFALISLVLCASPALADDASRARDLFQAAQKLYKANKFAEAIAKFEEALAAKPHPVIHFNIARCYEQLGEPAKALRSYRDYLRLAPDAKDRDAVSTTVAALERKLAAKGLQQLLVLATPETARIEVDGKDIGRTPASIELVAGEHKLVVTAEGYEKVERTFTFSTAKSSEQSVTLAKATVLKQPPPPPPPVADTPRKDEPLALTPNTTTGPTGVSKTVEPARKGKLFTWVAAGVAVAGVGAGVGLWAGANGQAATLRDGNIRTRAENDALVSGAQGMATGSAIAYGAAGAAAITAVVLFFLEGN